MVSLDNVSQVYASFAFPTKDDIGITMEAGKTYTRLVTTRVHMETGATSTVAGPWSERPADPGGPSPSTILQEIDNLVGPRTGQAGIGGVKELIAQNVRINRRLDILARALRRIHATRGGSAKGSLWTEGYMACADETDSIIRYEATGLLDPGMDGPHS